MKCRRLICYFTGNEDTAVLRKGPLNGPVFENYVVAETKKWIMHHGTRHQLFYFRTNLGIKIDLIIENPAGNLLQLIEIKSTETARPEMFQNILKIKELESRNRKGTRDIRGLLIYRGDTLADFREGCACANYFDCFNPTSPVRLKLNPS